MRAFVVRCNLIGRSLFGIDMGIILFAECREESTIQQQKSDHTSPRVMIWKMVKWTSHISQEASFSFPLDDNNNNDNNNGDQITDAITILIWMAIYHGLIDDAKNVDFDIIRNITRRSSYVC